MRILHHTCFAAGWAKFVSVYTLFWAQRHYQALDSGQ